MGFKAIITTILLFSLPIYAQDKDKPDTRDKRDLLKSQLQPVNPPREKLTNPDNWMVIIGDSGSTGASADPDLQPTLSSMWKKLNQVGGDSLMKHTVPPLSNIPNPARFNIDKMEAMTRVIYSMDEFGEASKKGQTAELNLMNKGSLELNIQEYANGYMIGRALGIKSEDIVLVGEGGARVNSISTQIERIYEINTETLPPLVLTSFTANDFCNERIFSDPMGRLVSNFEESLATSWKESEDLMRAHPKGTRFVILAPFNVANVLTNEGLMQQKIKFEKLGEITCHKLRNGETDGAGGDFIAKALTSEVTKRLSSMCPAVLKTKPTDKSRLDRIREIQVAFNEVWKKQIAKLNSQYNSKNIRFEYVEGTRNMQFGAGDAANDCFHPSVRGHAKVADYVLKEVFKK